MVEIEVIERQVGCRHRNWFSKQVHITAYRLICTEHTVYVVHPYIFDRYVALTVKGNNYIQSLA